MRMCLAFLILFLLFAVEANAQFVRGENVVLRHESDPLAEWDIELEFLGPSGSGTEFIPFHTLRLSEPELDIVTTSLGSEFFVFATEEGEFLEPSNIQSFSSIVVSGDTLDGLLNIPLGNSFVGFGMREPFEGSFWHSIGWIEFSRTDESLTILDNAVSHSQLFGGLGPSPGIVVGVPEPCGDILLWMTVLSAALVRKRLRRN